MNSRYLLIGAAITCSAQAQAHVNHLPQPWRAEAVVDGRDESYNDERFLHRYSFRHSQELPAVTGYGLRGTGGSVSSRRLYYDFRFRQDFRFNDDQQAFLMDIQRGTDFDGHYERQLLGFRHQLTDKTQIWFQGDVFADKSQADIYWSARRATANDGWLHGSWILPDTWFNDKTMGNDRITTEPQSFFIQWHQPWQDNRNSTTMSVTLSPEAGLVSERSQLNVESRGVRGAITHTYHYENWAYRLDYAGEYTTRDYWLAENNGSGNKSPDAQFRRQHHELAAEAQYLPHPNTPAVGLKYFSLREQGYFGRATDTEGTVDRREPMGFISADFRLSPRQTLRPAIYLGVPRVRQNFDSEGLDDRNSTKIRSKLALPLEITLSQQEPVVLTLAPTFRLHKAAFGGGNLQLHWPL